MYEFEVRCRDATYKYKYSMSMYITSLEPLHGTLIGRVNVYLYIYYDYI